MASPPAIPHKENAKETIISLIIALVLAFIFRSFVAEAFIIPTGSMAPTLMGGHMRFTSPNTGENWPVQAWYWPNGQADSPYPDQFLIHQMRIQRDRNVPPMAVNDPVTGLTQPVRPEDGKLKAGDRIFVLKYLYGIRPPEPWDVVVFKNPTQPEQNYIKRLIALENEQVALVDGDVFIRQARTEPYPKQPTATDEDAPFGPWAEEGWQIRRKPAHIQTAVWQPIYDSQLLLPGAVAAGAQSPWVVDGASTSGVVTSLTQQDSGRWFDFNGKEPAMIRWDVTRPFLAPNRADPASSEDRLRTLTDRVPYNQIPSMPLPRYPIGDLRIRMALTLQGDASALTLIPTIRHARHEFRALIQNSQVSLQMRPELAADATPWTILATAGLPALTPGATCQIEFWHVDQSLALYINERLVTRGVYAWSPLQRLKNTLSDQGLAFVRNGGSTANPLADPSIYMQSSAFIEIAGAPAQIHALALDRDLHYRPAAYGSTPFLPSRVGTPATATHPTSTLTLQPQQFFVCGDNSPASLDGRLWGSPDYWVADQVDAAPSTVHRSLMLGRAFCVYFPAPYGLIPDFGRLRLIE